ncbi:MAG: GNAT family N-acetyltransferase [Anaerolineaceae bacterium]|nr:GNAT family N-acetyltransferase [Anaerolineaceae bacterium]
MDKAEFDKIKAHAADFQHSSFQYIEFEELTDYWLLAEDDELILLRGYNKESNKDQYLWAANSVNNLTRSLPARSPFLLTFVPRAWVPALEAVGLTIRNIWHDYFRPDLDDIWKDLDTGFEPLSPDEINAASEISIQCRGQSRGFTGQSPDWFRQWLTGSEGIMNPAILGYRMNGELIGIVCTGLYGGEQENGPIVWIREVAVRPAHQGKGIGRRMVMQALQYGKHHGARKAFLAVDEENLGAIHLYESLGFVASDEAGEINMVKPAVGS